MLHSKGTFLSIDLNALVHNYNFFKSQLNDSSKVLAVIKAFAYGHEAISIAKQLEKESVFYFAVAYTHEGVALRNAGITTPILVFHPQETDVEICVKYQLEPTLYSDRIFNLFYDALKNKNIENFPIHIKFNTGLNRLGFSAQDVTKVLDKLIATNKTFKLTSVYSHLVASEDSNEKDFTLKQIQSYKRIVQLFEDKMDYPFIKHLTNTSGTINYPQAHFDMVRIGIGLYGYANEKKWTSFLKNVGSLQSIISQKHFIRKGDSVGYNRAFVATKDIISATIPIGHADGIPRTWSKQVGYVIINDKKAPVLGNVCMDMIMVDVTDIPCDEGDTVIIYDTQQTVEELAVKSKTISYEMLTAISQRVPRIIKN